MTKFIFNLRLLSVTLLLLISACSEKRNTEINTEHKVAKVIETTSTKTAPKILYITSVGWFHDYQQQIKTISSGINQYINADIDVIVGDVELLKSSDFSKGYDLLIYNFCHAAQRDDDLVQSLISPVTEKGIPLIALHCAMHSFQFDSQWAEFLGLHTLRHEKQRSMTVEKVGEHALIKAFPANWELVSDELYITLSQNDNTTPLLQSYGIETKKHHTQAWIYQSGQGQIIGTTLGHNESTLTNSHFQRFLANSIQYLLGQELTVTTNSSLDTAVNLLSKNVSYPDKAEKRCVIHNMFAIGGEKVKACVAKQCADASTVAECTAQCQKDNPWPVPETLREACQNNELTVPNL